jgi:hypothetical protein
VCGRRHCSVDTDLGYRDTHSLGERVDLRGSLNRRMELGYNAVNVIFR